MKIAKNLISVVLLASFATTALAASPNGFKPRCPMGQLPVLENGNWTCEEAKIKARTKQQRAKATHQRVKAAPVRLQRAKPDLSIANVLKQNDPSPDVDNFKVYVKNTGNSASAANKMSLNSTSGGGEINVPAIPADSGKWVQVKFFEFKKGSRIRLYVDSDKKITETNESNNKYAFNW